MEQTLEEPVNGQAQGSFNGAAAPQVQHRMRLFTRQAFEQRWPAIRPLLDPATPFNGGDYETDDLLTMVQRGQAFALGFLRNEECDFVMVLRVNNTPRKKVLFILSWGGPGMRRALRMFYPDILALAKRNGCQAIRGAMRPSMERYARRFLPDLNKLYSILETTL